MTVLASLVKEAKESQQLGEKIESTINRIKKASVGFGKEEIEKIAGAILEDVAKKAGLEQIYTVTRSFWSRFKAQKTSLMSAEDYVVKNTDRQALQAYLVIFRSLAEEFKERKPFLFFVTTKQTQHLIPIDAGLVISL